MEEQPRQSESLASSATEDNHCHLDDVKIMELLPNGMPKDGVEKELDLVECWPEEMYVPRLVIHVVKEEEPIEQCLL